MIKMQRIRITVDKRGKIKTGKRREGSGLPQSLEYFNVEAFPELVAAYGEKPSKLCVFMPTNEVEDAFDDSYVLYRGGTKDTPGTKVRSCNGETCIHRIDETAGEVKYAAGEETDCICERLPEKVPNPKKPGEEMANPQVCKYSAYLKAYIGIPPKFQVQNSSCYLFETHSVNSGDAMKSELMRIHTLTQGKLYGIPFMLSVDMVSGKENANLKFPIWHLQMHGPLIGLRPDRALTDGLDEAEVVQDDKVSLAAELTAELEKIQADGVTGEALDKWVVQRKGDLVISDRLNAAELDKVKDKYLELSKIVYREEKDNKGKPGEQPAA